MLVGGSARATEQRGSFDHRPAPVPAMQPPGGEPELARQPEGRGEEAA